MRALAEGSALDIRELRVNNGGGRTFRRRLLTYARLILPALLLSACADRPPTGPTPSPGVQIPMSMIAHVDGRDYIAADSIGFGAQVVDINKEGILLSALFEHSHAEMPVNSGDFRLTATGPGGVAPVAAHVEYTALDPFGGSLYWIAPAQSVSVWLGLYHISAGHYDFGPYPLTITRRPSRPSPPPALSSP